MNTVVARCPSFCVRSIDGEKSVRIQISAVRRPPRRMVMSSQLSFTVRGRRIVQRDGPGFGWQFLTLTAHFGGLHPLVYSGQVQTAGSRVEFRVTLCSRWRSYGKLRSMVVRKVLPARKSG